MTCHYYKDEQLYIEEILAADIANEFGTPCYIYSKAKITENWHNLKNALGNLPHQICYAVKANGNLALLQLFANLGAGFDIVSLGELKRVQKAGGDPAKIIFSGVGKTREEITTGIQLGIFCFNIESRAELERIAFIAKEQNKIVNIALRINPNIKTDTHIYITTGTKENKFGIVLEQLEETLNYIKTLQHIKLIGIACHIGSQITTLHPFNTALEQLISLYQNISASGIHLQYLDIGGGLGITYQNERPPSLKDYADLIREKCQTYPLHIILEPGRSLIGNSGLLLTRVEYLKSNGDKQFAIVDAGMTELLRPALYNAWQRILPLSKRSDHPVLYDIAGPVCESADILAKNRSLALQQDDLLAIDTVGAYGFSMSSNYNARPKPPEVLVDKDQALLIRERETYDALWSLERLL